MKLYIANCTTQNHDFIYNAPEVKGSRKQMIPAGGQMQIHDNMNLQAIDYIVKQHEKYGLVPADKIPREKAFIGLCYSVDKPVNMDQIMTASSQNENVLKEQAVETRKQTAAAIRSQIEDQEVGVSSVSVEIIQDEKSGMATGERLAQGIEVIETGKRSRRAKQMADE